MDEQIQQCTDCGSAMVFSPDGSAQVCPVCTGQAPPADAPPPPPEKITSCKKCGADLKFAPGVSMLKCPYCQHEMEIEVDQSALADAQAEQDFHAALNAVSEQKETFEVHTIKCGTCAAETTLNENIDADECPYCGTSIVRGGEATQKIIKPQALLPFKIVQAAAVELFQGWIKSRWFAPNKLKLYARVDSKLQGVYVPHWTYDSNTTTDYTGQRGQHYYETQRYTDSNGKSQTRRVRKTRWYYASGRVYNSFDDVLVLASESLPRKHAEKLEPWDLQELMPYQEEFLSGFRAENYSVGLEDGFERAKQLMEPEIDQTIRRDIGGDEQRISSKDVFYGNISFKHLLLPIWVSAFRFKNKVFRFLVNARTGEVQGERPWSWLKITGAVIAGIALIAGIVFLVKANQ